MIFPQRSGASLTLIAADIAPALNAAIANGEARWPLLAKLAGRGVLHRADTPLTSETSALRPAQRSLLETLSLTDRSRDYPSAALVRSGETGELASGTWAHLQCVHFAAGLSDVAAASLRGEAQLTQTEREELGATLSEHLRGEGIELHPSAEHWLVKLPAPLIVRTVAPDIAFQDSLARSLPQGEGAAALRRVMTEAQMLLHEHPVNVRRERNGLPPANAVWLWGVGTISEAARGGMGLPIAVGDDPYLKGLYLLYGESVQAQTSASVALGESPVRSDKDRLVIAGISELDELEREWLPALWQALRRGSYASAAVHLGDWRLRVTRAGARSFWKRPLPLSRWSA
jgi:hypothetical protein